MSYAVTLNHAAADNSAHWALWDIPATTTSLAANIDHVAMPPLPAGAKQGTQNLDGFTGIGYLGPCPQAVGARQMYRFTVWALKVATLGGLTSSSTTAAAQTAIKNAALSGGSATLTGPLFRPNSGPPPLVARWGGRAWRARREPLPLGRRAPSRSTRKQDDGTRGVVTLRT
jgi:hypothetical protein